MVFGVKPALIAHDNVAKIGSLYSLQRAKNLAAFCDHHLPWVVCQLAWDSAKMKIFIPSELCKRVTTVAGDKLRASASEYVEENGSLSKYAIKLASVGQPGVSRTSIIM
jgi:hypothetical protein